MNQVMCHIVTLLVVVFTLMPFSGCSKRYTELPAFSAVPFKDYPNESVGRFKTSYLADQIDNFYRGTDPGPIGITTFVNVDDLYSTSTFGRMVGEQLMSELAMKGYDVVELRHSDAIQFLSSAGEFALSRNVAAVRPTRDLGGVVVGTYTVSPVRVYLNARLLDPRSSIVLSAGSVEMEKTDELARLLRGGGIVTTMERIPVKHLGWYRYPLQALTNPALMESEDETGPQLPALSTRVTPQMPR